MLGPFGGCSTRVMAAVWTRRQAVLLEINPAYVDVIVRQWEETSGQPAILDGEDRTFDDIACLRTA
jgi:hypothetical protein